MLRVSDSILNPFGNYLHNKFSCVLESHFRCLTPNKMYLFSMVWFPFQQQTYKCVVALRSSPAVFPQQSTKHHAQEPHSFWKWAEGMHAWVTFLKEKEIYCELILQTHNALTYSLSLSHSFCRIDTFYPAQILFILCARHKWSHAVNWRTDMMLNMDTVYCKTSCCDVLYKGICYQPGHPEMLFKQYWSSFYAGLLLAALLFVQIILFYPLSLFFINSYFQL